MDPRIAALRASVAQLVEEGRHEEALWALQELRGLLPTSTEVQASLDQLKTYLAGQYAKALGGLDRRVPAEPVRTLRDPDALLVQRLSAGGATYEDVVRSCPLGRVRTLQILCELHGDEAAFRLALRGRPRSTADLPTRLRASSAPPQRLSIPAPSSPGTIDSPTSHGNVPSPSTDFADGVQAYVARRYDEAERAFRACLAIDPRNEAARRMLDRVEKERR